MKKLTILFALSLSLSIAYTQKERSISCTLDLHINNTLYDRTLANNGTGFGGGMHALVNFKSSIKGIVEFAADAYGGNKQLFLTADGKPIMAKSDVVTLFAGAVYDHRSKWFAGISAGPAFFNSSTWFAIKPLIGIPFLHQRMIFKMGMVNIFQRDEISHQGFGYLTFGLGVKIF